jgi:hypothetical protein
MGVCLEENAAITEYHLIESNGNKKKSKFKLKLYAVIFGYFSFLILTNHDE